MVWNDNNKKLATKHINGGGGEEATAKGEKRKLRRSVSMTTVGGRLASAAKEQRARLYIMRRCVSMLLAWIMQTVRLMTPEELALHGHAPEGQEAREGSNHLEEIMPCVHMLAIDVYGNYAVQKVLEYGPESYNRKLIGYLIEHVLPTPKLSYRVFSYCNNLEIYDTLAAEIIESVNKLSREKFADYVVQYLLEHGGQAKRSMMVSNFAGYVVSMSYNKFASNVIEACLTFGSQEDRQLITNEIITRKMVSVAEEQQVGVLVDVARSNVAYLV
nr:pumilio homolog 1-like [Setaria viridis]